MSAAQPEFRPAVSLLTDDSIGSFSRVARWFGHGFAELGVPYEAVTVQGPAGTSFDDRVRFVRLGVPRTYRWPVAIARYLHRARPDVCLVTPAYLIPFALTAGRIVGRPVVPWEASFLGLELRIEDINPRLRLVPPLERLTHRWAPVVAAVSRDVAEHVVRDVLRKPGTTDGVFILPNPVDSHEVARMAQPADISGSALRLCAVGRLVRQKGFDLLIEAAAIARPDLGEDWELVILGDGPQRAALDRLVRARGLNDRVRLPGNADNPYPLLAGADVFVHPARWEPFGVSLLEALALGIPVITTTCPGGSREMLSDGEFGLLVPPEDPDALAGAILALVRDGGRRANLAAAGLERAHEFAPASMARRVLDLRDVVLHAADGGPSVPGRRRQ